MKLKALLVLAGSLFCSVTFAAADIGHILESNIGDRSGKILNSGNNCGVSVEKNQDGDYRLTYYPGWANGTLGQVAYYSDSSRWSVDSDVLKVRLFTNAEGRGVVSIKFDIQTNKFISGQLDNETEACVLQ